MKLNVAHPTAPCAISMACGICACRGVNNVTLSEVVCAFALRVFALTVRRLLFGDLSRESESARALSEQDGENTPAARLAPQARRSARHGGGERRGGRPPRRAVRRRRRVGHGGPLTLLSPFLKHGELRVKPGRHVPSQSVPCLERVSSVAGPSRQLMNSPLNGPEIPP